MKKIILIPVIMLVTSCSLFKYTGVEKRRDKTLECIRGFSDDGVDLVKAYKVCTNLYKKENR